MFKGFLISSRQNEGEIGRRYMCCDNGACIGFRNYERFLQQPISLFFIAI